MADKESDADWINSQLEGINKDYDQRAANPPTKPANPDEEWANKQLANLPKREAPAKPLPVVPDASDASFAGQNLQVATPWGTLDTHVPMPASVTKGLAQVGSGIEDSILGAKQLMGKATREQVDEKRRVDDPLNKGFMGTVNNIIGKSLPFAALPALPEGALGAGLGMGIGALQGAVEPVGTNDSRGLNTAIGAAIPGMGPITKAWLGAAAPNVTGPLARSASEAGYKIVPGDTGGIMGKIRDITDQIPLPGMAAGKGAREAENRVAYNTNVAKAWGGSADSIADTTGKKFIADKDRIVGTMQSVWKNNNFEPNSTSFWRDIDAIKKAPGISEDVEKAIDGQIALLRKNMKTDTRGIEYIDGEGMKRMQSQLFAADSANPAMNEARDAMRQTFLDHYKTQLKPKEAAKLEKSMGEYRAWSTAKDAVAASHQGNTGIVSPNELGASIATKYGDRESPFGDAVRHAKAFAKPADVESRAGNSLLIPSGIGGLGAAAHYLGLAAPSTIGLAGVGALGAGAVANRGLNSPAMYKLGTMGADRARAVTESMARDPAAVKAMREAGAGVVRRAPVAGALTLTEGHNERRQRGKDVLRLE